MAIAAKFDLEMRQMDAVNAFANSQLDEDIYVKPPPGFFKSGVVFRLRKALYGLRRSPLLWQQDLSQTARSLGLIPIPEDECIFTGKGVTLFFYMDDIIILYRKKGEQ